MIIIYDYITYIVILFLEYTSKRDPVIHIKTVIYESFINN